MNLFSPLVIASLIIALVSLAGIIANSVKRSKTFLGYEALADDIRRIAATIPRCEVFRDGDDMVISGNREQLPVILRFSHSETTPGLTIRCGAPVDFGLSFSPKGQEAPGERFPVRTPSLRLNSIFTVRTSDPEHAKLLLSSSQALQHIEKICLSGNTFLVFSPGYIELGEFLIPSNAAEHALSRLESLGILSRDRQTAQCRNR